MGQYQYDKIPIIQIEKKKDVISKIQKPTFREEARETRREYLDMTPQFKKKAPVESLERVRQAREKYFNSLTNQQISKPEPPTPTRPTPTRPTPSRPTPSRPTPSRPTPTRPTPTRPTPTRPTPTRPTPKDKKRGSLLTDITRSQTKISPPSIPLSPVEPVQPSSSSEMEISEPIQPQILSSEPPDAPEIPAEKIYFRIFNKCLQSNDTILDITLYLSEISVKITSEKADLEIAYMPPFSSSKASLILTNDRTLEGKTVKKVDVTYKDRLGQIYDITFNIFQISIA